MNGASNPIRGQHAHSNGELQAQQLELFAAKSALYKRHANRSERNQFNPQIAISEFQSQEVQAHFVLNIMRNRIT